MKVLILSKQAGELSGWFLLREQSFETVPFSHDIVPNTESALRLIEREPCAYSMILIDRAGFEEDELERFASQVWKIASPLFPRIVELDDRFEERNSKWYECTLRNLLEIPSIGFVQLITDLIRLRDGNLFEHFLNVKVYSSELAKLCVKNGIIDETTAEMVSFASFFHDIGKLLISDEILHKPSKLTPQEFESMKLHTVLGTKLFEKIIRTNKENRLLITLHRVIKYHHERFDGKGYPEALQGDQIPVEARIVSVADVFDALTSSRSYREAYTPSEAISIMTADEGHFDPQILEIFLRNFELFQRPLRVF
ncbi:MAG: Metal dependent phosphohydrolase [Thermotoga sp. 50_1627]|nr:MAG: Metal dependent phosphohydrolase [Thermotoga sp. 50_64]KUK24452.1 MAG: Metal dependent phosphohydrolase [Thermotoga sp. 50_1627]MDK2922941.1 hypothetical protein [Pseudothermotoga sp.]